MLYLATDTETGGFDSKEYDLLQAGFALYSPKFEELWSYEFGISLQKYRTCEDAMNVNKLDLNHLRMTGLIDPQLTLDYVGDGFNVEHYEAMRQLVEMRTKLRQLSNDRMEIRMLCHNVIFDKPFIDLWFPWLKELLSYRTVCTISTAVLVQDAGRLKTKNLKLETLAKHFKIAHDDAHSALCDARAAMQLYAMLVSMVRE